MDWHVFVVLGVIFYVSHLRSVQSLSGVEAKIREKRTPQNNGNLFEPNLGGDSNIKKVASNVRKRLHDLIDSVTNPLIGDYTDLNHPEPNYDYSYDYQQYNNRHPGPPFEHGRYRGGPPHRYHHRGPPSRGHHPRGPPFHHYHGPPPHYHGPPPHHHGPRPRGPPPRFFPDITLPDHSTEEVSQKSEQTRPDFSEQPNYPIGEGFPSTTTFTDLDENTEANNVAGYIEDNFPVILLKENEIRR